MYIFPIKMRSCFFVEPQKISKSLGVCQWKSRGMDCLEEMRVSSVVFFGCFWEFIFCVCIMLYVVVYVILCMSIVIH